MAPHEPEPTDYWLSNLDADTPLREMVQLAKMRWRVEHDYRELKTGLGIDHFEGRSMPGWYRHVTLVSLAQAIRNPTALRPKSPCAGLTLYTILRELQTLLAVRHRRLPHLPPTPPRQLEAPSPATITQLTKPY